MRKAHKAPVSILRCTPKAHDVIIMFDIINCSYMHKTHISVFFLRFSEI